MRDADMTVKESSETDSEEILTTVVPMGRNGGHVRMSPGEGV